MPRYQISTPTYISKCFYSGKQNEYYLRNSLDNKHKEELSFQRFSPWFTDFTAFGFGLYKIKMPVQTV